MSIFKKNFYMQIVPGVSNAFGFGETEKDYKKRQKMRDYSKAKGYAFAVGAEEWKDFWWWENRTISNVPKNQDTVVHKFLQNIPGIEYKDEVFRFKEGYGLTLEIIKNMIHQKFFSDAPATKEYLELYEHQKEFIAKVQADYLEFLLFAKCRAGKTVMVLSHIVERKKCIDKGCKTTLIVSRQKSPMQSWKDDIDKFGNFTNLVFININDKDYIQQIDYWYNTDKQLILWACVQSRRILNLPVDVDLLVYDEAHVGYDSAQWRKLRDVINCPVMYATGTAYKMVWNFTDSNRYIYDYYREQLDKKNGLNNSSSMRVVLSIYESAQYRAIFGDDPDAMKNMFNVDGNGDFIHPELVQDFVTNKFVTRLLRTQNRLLKDSTHLYITLPSVAACYAFAKFMGGTRFAPLVVTGDSGKNADDINKHIKENENGSCILTRTANVLGVTAKEVDTIINCAEGSSVEFWTQFAFRGGSSDRDWLVIDFCPQRCLKSLRQSFVVACDTNPELAQYTFTDFIVIDEWNEGFTTLNHDQVVALLAADVGDTINLVSGIADRLNFKNLENIDFQVDLEASYSSVAKSVLLNDNGANGKTNKKKENQSEKSEKSVLYSRQETIKAILERVPLVIYHCLKCGEQVNSIYNVIESEHYIHDTMDCEEIIRQSIDEDVINPKTLSYTISQASDDIRHFMNEDECETLSKLSCSGKTQQQLSIELLDELFKL